jgi:AcrR family transcriptional regulator
MTARNSKSERTRTAILEAARRMFELHGYERATVRDIAGAAAIDPAMVIRYFGSKDELFARVATIDLELPPLTGLGPPEGGEILVRHFLSIWEGERANKGLAILLRSAASNELAAARLRSIFASQVMPALASVGSAAQADDRAALVATQLLGLAFCRYVVQMPPVVALTQETIIRDVGRTLNSYIYDTR